MNMRMSDNLYHFLYKAVACRDEGRTGICDISDESVRGLYDSASGGFKKNRSYLCGKEKDGRKRYVLNLLSVNDVILKE